MACLTPTGQRPRDRMGFAGAETLSVRSCSIATARPSRSTTERQRDAVEVVVSRMDETVTAELEALEELCRAATRNRPAPDDAHTWLLAYACGALATLLHLGLITPDEDARWRGRLQPAFGDDLRLQGYAEGAPSGPRPRQPR